MPMPLRRLARLPTAHLVEIILGALQLIAHELVVAPHHLDRLRAEVVHRVHRTERVVEALLQLFDPEERVRRKLAGLLHVLTELAARLGNEIADGAGQALQHLHDLDLIARRTRHRLRRRERRHAGGGHAVAAVDHFSCGLLEDVEREIAVHVDRLLRQHVLQVLPRIEQDLLFQCPATGRVRALERGDLLRELAVELLREVDRAFQLLHRLPQLRLDVLDLDRIALHIVARRVHLLHGGFELAARRLELPEVGLQLVAPRDHSEDLIGRKQIALLAGIQLVEMATHVLDCLERGGILQADEVALHEAPGHQICRARDLLATESERGVDLALEPVRFDIRFAEQRVDEAVDLLVDLASRVDIERYHVGRLVGCDGMQHLRRLRGRRSGLRSFVRCSLMVSISDQNFRSISSIMRSRTS